MCAQYYDDAAGILRSIILSAIAPHRLATAPSMALPAGLPGLPGGGFDGLDGGLPAFGQGGQLASDEPDFAPYAAVDSSDEIDERCVLQHP